MRFGLLMTLVACFMFVNAAVAAEEPGYATTWSKANDVAGFEVESGTITWTAKGGNPGGFVKVDGTVVPKPYLRSSLRQVFGTGQGTIAFDVKVLDKGTVTGARMFLSTGGQAFWYEITSKNSLGHDQTASDGWVHYTIPFKSDWTEAEALAQGWHPYGGEMDKWAEVVANPGYSTLSFYATPDPSQASPPSIGLDNFRIETGTVLDKASRKLIEPPPPQDKPVVSYTFDEGKGEALHDRAGNAPVGKISGAKWVPYGGRWALEFDGVDNHVNLGAVNVVGPQTVVMWIYAEPIYSVWQATPILRSGSFQVSYKSRGEMWAGGANGFLPYRKWTHVATVSDGKTCALYVDGAFVNLVASKEPISGQELLLAPPRPVLEGEPPEYAQRFKGKIASLQFYNRPLTHEDVLEDLRTSNVTNSPMSMSVPQPGFNRIKVEVDAARLGKPLKDLTVTVDVLQAGDSDDKPALITMAKQFDSVGRAVIDLDAPSLPKGDYIVRTTAKDGTGKALGAAGEEPLAWSGSVSFPSGPEGAKKLNNLVTELLRVAGPDESNAEHSFVNPRAGFVYISNLGSQEVKLVPAEGGGEALDLVLSHDYGDAFETQRYLPKGKYTITTPVAKDLIVRAVAQTVHDYAETEPYVKGFGPYAGEFEERYIFPHNNTLLIHENNIDKPFAQEWKSKGRRIVDHMGTAFTAKEGQSDADAVYEMLSSGVGFNHPMYDGYLVDEFSASAEYHRLWSDALERLFSDSRFKTKTMHAWTYAYYDLVTYFGGEPGRQFVATLMKYDSPIQWETYLDSVRTELAAWQHINEKIVGEAVAAEKVVPGITQSLIVVPYSYVTGGPPWLTMTLPTYDTRTYLEMQFRTVATHPAFEGVRGFGIYRSPYTDEETARWVARLFRHYAIEGKTEPLGKDPFLLTHIQNPEFEQQGAGWDVEPVEKDSIQFGMKANFGNLQSRYTGRNGECVLITRRSEKAPNRVSQEIKNLEPGRLYSFRMFSADRNDMTSPHPHGVNIEFENTELLPEKSFTHTTLAKGRSNDWLNWHVRTFRAKGTTSRLIISDWTSEADPGGPTGQELIYNFIKIQPYWPPD